MDRARLAPSYRSVFLVTRVATARVGISFPMLWLFGIFLNYVCSLMLLELENPCWPIYYVIVSRLNLSMCSF